MTKTTRAHAICLALAAIATAFALLVCLPATSFADERTDPAEGSITGVTGLTARDADGRTVIDTVYVNTASLYFHDGDQVVFTGTVPAGSHYGFALSKNAAKWGYDDDYAGFEEWRSSNDYAVSSDNYDYEQTFSTFDSDFDYVYSVCLMVDDADKYCFSDNTKLILNGREISEPGWLPDSGRISVAFQEAATLSRAPWFRLWGSNALETTAQVARAGWDADDTDVAVVATMSGYHDALAAAPLAGAHHAPVLLTRKSELSAQTRAELERLDVSKVFIVGGPAAVSFDVDAAIKDMGITVERVYGSNAQETAVAIGKKAREGNTPSGMAIVATGGGYHDALAMAPWAYAQQVPVYLTNKKGELSAETLAAIAQGGHFGVAIAGGPAAIPEATEQQLKDMGLETVRLGGGNALETSNKIATWCVEDYPQMDCEAVGVATAGGYHDALAGAALCGRFNVPLVLVPKKGTNYYSIDHYVSDHLDSMAVGIVFGGPAAVNDNVWFYLCNQYEERFSL